MESVDVVVVGAGVIGLAVARELALRGLQGVIIERERWMGSHTSSRNSEVIHAGLYYPPGSLKARLCVEGRERLYRYCEERGIHHRRCGKLIVATEAGHRESLERIALRAQAAGAGELSWLSGLQARALEPALCAHSALLSPRTGVVDSHGVMASFLGEAEDRGFALAVASELVRASVCVGGGFRVSVQSPGEVTELFTRVLVNAGGLFATDVARSIEGLDPALVPQTLYAKGNYFSLSGVTPFSRLIYPVPNEAGLGVHLTLDLGGRARFGPDVEWIDAIDYRVDPDRCRDFYQEIRQYWPGLPDESLRPDYAGIRPKLVGEGAAAADFRIDGSSVHGVAGLVNLFGIESPGLTASLPLAALVVDLALEQVR
jgi:L-2-hydroxyglutarate oxidase LhgO